MVAYLINKRIFTWGTRNLRYRLEKENHRWPILTMECRLFPAYLGRMNVEAATRSVGEALLRQMARQRGALLPRALALGAAAPEVKTALLRYVDLLPSLHTGREKVGHLQALLAGKAPPLEALLRLGAYAPPLAGAAIQLGVRLVARQFVAGPGPGAIPRILRANARRGWETTFDLLGEAVLGQAEADAFLERNLAALAALRSVKGEGEARFPRGNLSLKISALAPGLNPAAPEAALAALKPPLHRLLRAARDAGVLVHFDMEAYALRPLTLALFASVLDEAEFAQGPALGIALQAYLRETEGDLRALIAHARARRRVVAVRLVKGAYWDYEVLAARQRSWPVPVWETKAETDLAFEALSRLLLEHTEFITPAFASHNVRSVAHAIAQAEALGLPREAYEFQALYGMAGDLKAALVAEGHRVREYAPLGAWLPGMAYLVRRLLENSSNEGFLHARAAGTPSALLLQTPHVPEPPPPPTPRAFRNAANTDFTQPEAAAPLRAALSTLQASPPQHWPLRIGGLSVETGEWHASHNPAQPAQLLGHWAVATEAEVEAAIATARAAQPAWEATPVTERAAVLDRLATLLEAHRPHLTALEILEAGKPWPEADADVSEAVDFCRYYAAEMRRLAPGRTTQPTPGESNQSGYFARGVGVVIAPWNFPLAILCGMAVAALVGGNAVILKPAEQSSLLGAALFALLEEAGLPPGVGALLMGEGERIGPALVSHPGVDFIAFTGSRAVGTAIYEQAARTREGQRGLKKVVCEMGGKNALILDTTADLDEAIPAALHSAFAYAGQKCSALSRLIVLEGIYDTFLPRFLEAAAALPVGDPRLPETLVGPVIDADAQARIARTIREGAREATLAWQGYTPEGGFYIAPTLFTEVPPHSALAREEIFGPVLCILRAASLDDAFALANDTPYALTGGVFSRTPQTLERARRELRVGNLYLNRGITGALVERHPFGGFGMSGTGPKAGGRGYVEAFLHERLITENEVRRGFAPER